MANNQDAKRVYDGFVTLEGGMDAGSDSSLLERNQAAFLGNMTVRGDLPVTRPAYQQQILNFDNATTQSNFTGIVQGRCFYEAVDDLDNAIIVSIAGRLFRINVAQNNFVTDITPTAANPATLDFVHLFQAENYAIDLAKSQRTVIFDGSSSHLASPSELPSGFIGVYAWGRIWMSYPDKRSFIAGDLMGSSSGTPGAAFVDAILHVTENTFLNGGGVFRVASTGGPINAMIALSSLDSSLGIGPILVGTTNLFNSIQAPVDRTIWQNLTYPIDTVALIGVGPLGPYNTISVNGDVWMRSIDGIRSFIAARSDFQYTLGKTPQSFEISPILDRDTGHLLFYGSGIFFNNRILYTVSPYSLTSGGVAHRGLVAMNQDTVSTLSEKGRPVWEGLWTGLNICTVVKGFVNRQEAAWAICDNQGTIELWKLMDDGELWEDECQVLQDNGVVLITRKRIESWLNSRAHNFGDPFMLKKLIMGELYFDEIVGVVDVTVKYKPDQFPNWTVWKTFQLCATVEQCALGTGCTVWKENATQYAARVTLPRPSDDVCNTIVHRPMNLAYDFQFRLEFTGHIRLRKFKVHALNQPQEMEGDCPSAQVACTAVETCEDNWFSYSAHCTPPAPPPPPCEITLVQAPPV